MQPVNNPLGNKPPTQQSEGGTPHVRPTAHRQRRGHASFRSIMNPLRALVFCALLLCDPASCGKVLVVPLPSAESHTFVMVKVTQELAARGHEVLMVVPESDMSTLDKVDISSFNVTTYRAAYTKQEVKELVRGTRQAVGSNFLGSLESFLVYLESLMEYCKLFLADTAVEAIMKEFNPDVLVGDVAYACALGQSEILRRGESRGRLPRVMVSALPILDPLVPGRMENMPNNLAYVPQMGTSLSNRMTFLERLKNTAFYYGSLLGERWRALPLYIALGKQHNVDCLSTPVSHGSTMFLYNMDFAMEWPRPLPPNVQLVGALLPTAARPLPADFEAILQDVEPQGAVYASMGTLCNFGPEEFVAIGQALSALPNLVIWKLAPGDLPGNATVKSLNLASNIKVVEWTPQNDLLGDSRVKAFVTHGGLNSIYEAAFHGVPVVGIPVFGDQPDNVMKAVYRGFGIMIPPGTITAEGLKEAVEKVLGDASFREAARKVSVRMRAHRLKPAEKAADWIEHVIATDGDQYLKTPEHLLPWHVRAMLDVYLALALFFGGLLWLAATGVRRLVFGRRRKATITEEKGPAGASKSVSGARTFHVVASAGQGAATQAKGQNWGVVLLSAAAGAAAVLVAAAFC